MNRKSFIKRVAAVTALQAIPAALIPRDINCVQAQTSARMYPLSPDECIPAIRLGDILISPDGEAYQVIELDDVWARAKVIDGDVVMMCYKQQAAAMVCHDWDDLDG